jgi:hypothetical protein
MSESMERPARPPLLDENDRPGPPPIMSEEPRRSSKGLTVFIAMFALVAFGGIVWYAYDQGRKTGSEETAPLIRADTAPVRVRPEKPGGLDVPHQDKLIFEKLTDGASKDARPVERLLPRPEQPAPPPAPAAAPVLAPAPEAVPPARKPTTVAQAPAPKSPPTVGVKTAPKRANAPRRLLPPAPSGSAAVIPPAPKADSKPRAVVKNPPPKVASKPKPKSPPKTEAKSASGAVVRPVPGGRFRVQIAAFKNEAAARAAWQKAQGANKSELGALGLTIERINIAGKGTFHRVQGGPLDEARARQVCRVLDTRKQACIVVRR